MSQTVTLFADGSHRHGADAVEPHKTGLLRSSVCHSRPRVGIYIPGTGSGGPWRYVHSILAGIDLDEFEVKVFCDIQGAYLPRPKIEVVPIRHAVAKSAAAANGSLQSDTSQSPGNWRRSSLRRFVPTALRMWAGFAREARRLAALFREHPVDLLHTQNTGCEESGVAARLACISSVLGTFHVDSTYDLHNERSGLTHRVLEHLSNHCLHKSIGVSHATSRDWICRTHLRRRRVLTIHNGIDPDKFCRRMDRAAARAALGLPDDNRLIIGGVGRLEEAKGFCFLIEAVALLAGDYPKLEIVLAGQGPLREPLAAQAARLGIADRVRFLGFCEDVQVVYDVLDVFVLSSRCEALPYAMLEAMASCLPIVGTTVAGIAEVIVQGKTGLLVPPGDAAAIAGALRTLLDSPKLRDEMGQAGRARVIRHFNESDMVRDTIAVYRDML